MASCDSLEGIRSEHSGSMQGKTVEVKDGSQIKEVPIHDVEVHDQVLAEKLGNMYDRTDMRRMGKMQQLRRNFRFISIYGYSVIMGSVWPVALATGILSLTNGGPAGAVWMYLITAGGLFLCMLSMAEMASMAPTSGGQYHWVSEFAPPKYQKPLSYMVGWLCVLGWQAGMVAAAYTPAINIQGLIALNHPGYTLPGWHACLITIGISCLAIFFNTILVRKLPLFEGLVMFLYIFGFVAVVTVLWVMGPRSSAKEVFTSFQDNAGWGNVGLSTLIGILAPFITMVGADSACHLSEELKDAAYVLPRSMFATATTNYTLGFIMIITFMFTLGNSEEVLATAYGQPYIQVFYNATGSKAGASILVTVVIVLLLFCAINQVTTTSRQLFAFSRDNGVPFSHWLAQVEDRWDIPLHAVMATFVSTVLLSLIVIGSTIAFNIVTSLSGVALLSSYIIAVGCMALKRIKGEPLLPSRFSLGRAGIYINCTALCFLVVVFVMLFFPSAPHPDAAAMNWTILIYGLTVAFAITYYLVKGRFVYVGPVEYVRKDN